jgi:hypothetical protein
MNCEVATLIPVSTAMRTLTTHQYIHLPGQELLDRATADPRFDCFFDPDPVPSAEEALVRPVLLTAEAPRRILWGFRYRSLWHEPGAVFPCLAVDAPSPTEAVCLALTAEHRAGVYSLKEIDAILSVLESFAAVATGDLLDLLDPRSDVRAVRERYRALPPDLATALDQGAIDLRTAEAIPAEWAATLPRLIDPLASLSFSNRRQAVRMAVELLRAGADPEELIAAVTDAAERGTVLPVLRSRRYPTLTDLQRRVSTLRREALGGTGVQLKEPPNFEGGRFELSFTFASSEEFRRRVAAAAAVEELVDELMDLLF